MARGLANEHGRTLSVVVIIIDDTDLQNLRKTVFKCGKVFDWELIIKNNLEFCLRVVTADICISLILNFRINVFLS